MSGSTFSAQVDEWVRATKERMTAVFRASAQEVVEVMQTPVGAGGNMPILTGALRASLQLSTEGPAPAIQKSTGGPVAYTDVATLVIAGAAIGQTIWATYGMNYAPAVEYGANGREGRAFVRLAAQRWPQIVAAKCGELRARAGA